MRSIIISDLTKMIKSAKDLEKLQFKYYISKILEKDSPLVASISFLTIFIKDLDENSPFIYPLILLYSGNYFYHRKNIYGHGLNKLKYKMIYQI